MTNGEQRKLPPVCRSASQRLHSEDELPAQLNRAATKVTRAVVIKDGHDVIVVEYQQVSQTSHLKFELSQLPSPLKGAEPFYRGRLWLDAETAQLRREVREMTLRLPSVSHPLVLFRFDLDYADSRFGFLTPQRIVMTSYSRGRTGVDKKPELLLGGKITFEYGAFTRFDVDTPDASLTPPAKR